MYIYPHFMVCEINSVHILIFGYPKIELWIPQNQDEALDIHKSNYENLKSELLGVIFYFSPV